MVSAHLGLCDTMSCQKHTIVQDMMLAFYNNFNLQIENMSHIDPPKAFVSHFFDNKFEHFYHKMCNYDSINVAV